MDPNSTAGPARRRETHSHKQLINALLAPAGAEFAAHQTKRSLPRLLLARRKRFSCCLTSALSGPRYSRTRRRGRENVLRARGAPLPSFPSPLQRVVSFHSASANAQVERLVNELRLHLVRRLVQEDDLAVGRNSLWPSDFLSRKTICRVSGSPSSLKSVDGPSTPTTATTLVVSMRRTFSAAGSVGGSPASSAEVGTDSARKNVVRRILVLCGS